MLTVKELLETGIKEGIDSNKIMGILADSLDCEYSKLETVEKLYMEIYENKLCDKFCCKMVDKMFNNTEHGKKWTLDQTNEVARKIGITFSNSKDDYSPHEFWCVMHMMYYDYGEALNESGITDLSVYGKLADAYLDDKDAPSGKLVNYFFFVEKSYEN